MALLTPKDIRKHTFQTVRFKEGYDVDEVDDFLDQVTETIEALGKQAVQGSGQSTQSLGADVAALNGKIAELTTQLQSAQEENSRLKETQGTQASQVDAAKLTEAEESNRALSAQNEQLKAQVERLGTQVDQLTAQAADAAGAKELGQQLTAVQHERDELRVENQRLARDLQEANTKFRDAQTEASKLTEAVSQQSGKLQDVSRQLEEARQREDQLRAQVSKMEPNTETGSLQKIAGAANSASSEPERATAMLTLAMQLHDQYVDKGKAQAKEIVTTAQNKYDNMVSKANEYSTRTRSEADEYSNQTRGKADTYSKNVHADADAYSAKTRQDADIYSKNKRTESDTYEAEVQRRAAEYDSKTRSGADSYAQQVRENLESQSKVIESNIQGLKQFEGEYRSRLTDFLNQLVAQVSDTNSFNKVDQSKN
ncbi:DivIVA domain-containing protein [uncultured Bifidobacterium sp.]|uniref:DivIVA domain-containing protein n=1 Tax=uncultured Bifidobacterium sp. TaxID=165187 RepID=UPI002617B111|nr:DivIVA domain-containing protein [uncultured Bifidobacterium sp.]